MGIDSKLSKIVKEDEEVVAIVRRYFLVFIFPMVLGSMLIIASFFLMWPMFRLGSFGVAGFGLLLLIGIYYVFKVYYEYSNNVFIITSLRIIDIDQEGFFSRTVSETNYEKIQDVSLRYKGISQTLFKFGDIIIQTAGQVANIELQDVKYPERVQQTIIELQRENNQKK